jgi:hypothetical protein
MCLVQTSVLDDEVGFPLLKPLELSWTDSACSASVCQSWVGSRFTLTAPYVASHMLQAVVKLGRCAGVLLMC